MDSPKGSAGYGDVAKMRRVEAASKKGDTLAAR